MESLDPDGNDSGIPTKKPPKYAQKESLREYVWVILFKNGSGRKGRTPSECRLFKHLPQCRLAISASRNLTHISQCICLKSIVSIAIFAEISQEESASEDCKRPRLTVKDDEEKNTKQQEKVEMPKPAIIEEVVRSGSSNVLSQNPDNEVADNIVKMESKFFPSFGKNSSKRITASKPKDQKDLSPTQKNQLMGKVIETEENQVMCDLDETGYPSDQFENIVKPFVNKILDVASKTMDATTEDALIMISEETSRLLKDCSSRPGTGAEMSSEISIATSREPLDDVDAKTNIIIEEDHLKETNLSQPGLQVGENELMFNKNEMKKSALEDFATKTDDVTTERNADWPITRKDAEDDGSKGGGCVAETTDNITSEKQDASCSSTIEGMVENVPPKAAEGRESVRQNSEQDGHKLDNDVPSDRYAIPTVQTDLVTCERSYEEKGRTSEENINKIQQNVSESSKRNCELSEQDSMVSGDGNSPTESNVPTASYSVVGSQEKSKGGDLPNYAELDFTSSQLLQLEEVETEMLQQETSSKVEGTALSIQSVQDEDTDGIASRRQEEERRDDRRVKEIMQKMMKDLNEIKHVTGSLLSQMTQYRKHRSQRHPQPSRLTGTHATSSAFYRGKVGKGSGSSQFKKS